MLPAHVRCSCHLPRVRRQSGGAGFTLLELLTVIAVIAILFTLSVGAIRGVKQRAAIARARAEIAALTQALENYKRHYGDYPQTGNAAQATPIVGGAIGTAQAQALLLNALIGVYGPTSFATRINGPTLIEVSKFVLEIPLTTATTATFAVPQGSPPIKQVVANCLLDPWGNRYMYYYKPAPTPGRPPVNTWRAPAYVLYSVGPDGQHTAPAVATGLFTGTTQTTGTNADNIYATP
ncbi:prepilin-type N-terminal cleavage/methylation domain-containing protein [Horticoccus sp. 23ND18S-11]|uniref:prepilin-type N-terminal cleavage/methylation domain-containing protein n=1 Tax=Horticoccus sp. 23ND18S-11 TaxID=3391832 RepID=UPI0039C90C42